MEIDINGIISIILSALVGGFLFSAIDRIRFKKQNFIIKDSETKSAEEDAEAKDIQNEKDKIGLGDMYIESIKNLMGVMRDNSSSVSRLNDTMEIFMNKIAEHDEKFNLVEGFLDGPFSEYCKNAKKKEHKYVEKE